MGFSTVGMRHAGAAGTRTPLSTEAGPQSFTPGAEFSRGPAGGERGGSPLASDRRIA
jgi:hypothetical protein